MPMDNSTINWTSPSNGSNPGNECGFTSQFKLTFGDSFESSYVKYRLFMDVIIPSGLCLFGLVGNILSFVVLGYIPGQSTPVLLRALSIADIIYLLSCICFQVFKPIHLYIPRVNAGFPSFANVETVVWPIATTAQTTSVWLVVLVTGDRCLGISRPLHAKSVATVKKTLVSIAAVCVFAVLFNLPTVFDMRVKTIRDPCTNETRLEAAASELAKNATYQLVYKTILCFIFRIAMPLLLVVLFNVRILSAIKRSRRQSQGDVLNLRERSPESHSRSLNHVVACVVAIFVICELPDFTYRILRAVMFSSIEHSLDWESMSYFAHFSNLMLTVNSSVNFIAYCVMGKKFRQILKETSCRCRRRPPAALRQISLSTKMTTLTNRLR